MMKSRVKKRDPEANKSGPTKVFAKVKESIVHALDILTDLLLASELYWLSRNDPSIVNRDFTYDYNIGFTIVCIATLGPYLI